MEFEQLLKLIEKVSEAKLDRFSYREGDLELKMGMNAQKDYREEYRHRESIRCESGGSRGNEERFP